MSDMDRRALTDYIVNLPCVRDGRVRMDVRGPWPTLIIGLKAEKVESRDEVIHFLIQYLD